MSAIVSVRALPTLELPRESSGRARTNVSMVASAGAHALLLLVLVLLPRESTPSPPVTEITLLEPGDAGAPEATSAAAAATAPEAAPGVIAPSDREERFRRAPRAEAMRPDPQNDRAFDDRLNARLAAMQSESERASAGVVVNAPPSVWAASPMTVSGHEGGLGTARPLTRGGGLGGSPLPLARGAGEGPSVALASAPAPVIERPAPAQSGETTARRTLAGATLMGPIADRPVLSHVTPIYPEWAKRDAVEGSVTLYFVVEPNGEVRENVLVQRTAGFGDFDENARAAIRAWRFAPLADGRVGEQWGTITFHFRLRDTP